MILTKKTPKDLRLRRGRVLIDEITINTAPEDVLAILAHFVVIGAEYNFSYGSVEYRGYCHLFDKLKEGEVLPEYTFLFTQNWRKQITKVEAVRKEI